MGTCFFKTKNEKLVSAITNFFLLSAKNIEGKIVSMSEYKNKVALLVVNVACK